MNKVYIVEDDPVIAGSVASHLEKWQMKCQCAQNFEKITEEMQAYQPDIILLDIKLPYYNGFYWCAEIRKLSKVPIVFLSSADDNMNIVMAMNMGADDFIAKPFDLQVLVAKLQAILRRSYGEALTSHTIECGSVTLNLDDTSVMADGTRLELTQNEYLMLKIYKHISVQLDNLDHPILTDEKWFAFVLEQILSNALKYTSQGTVTIAAKEETQGLKVSVSDTGIGIRAEDLPRVFEKGFTGYNGRMDKKASGLGLYLCKGICGKLGHLIRIDSKINEGTTVEILVQTERVKRGDLTKM